MRLGQEVRAARILTLLLRLDTPLSPTLSCALEEGRSALRAKVANNGDDWNDAERGEKRWACKHCADADGGQGAPKLVWLTDKAEPMLTAAALTELARLQGALCLVLARPIHPSCVCVCARARVRVRVWVGGARVDWHLHPSRGSSSASTKITR
jgi:hypothetical protein